MLAKQLLPAFGALRLGRIRRPLVERWFDVHSQTAPESANKALQLLRQILNAAVATGLIAANPTQDIKSVVKRTKLTPTNRTKTISQRAVRRGIDVLNKTNRHHALAPNHNRVTETRAVSPTGVNLRCRTGA